MGKFVERPCNENWRVWQNIDGRYDPDSVQRAILLDIREELRTLTRLLNCKNFVEVPAILRHVIVNTTRKKVKHGH